MENVDVSDEENETSNFELYSNIDVTFPTIHLDSFRCYPLCTVLHSLDKLSNKTVGKTSSVDSPQTFGFPGTCGTQILSDFSYWEVNVQVDIQSKLNYGSSLCEIGVASKQAMETCVGGVTPTNKTALTVHLYMDCTRLKVKTLYKNVEISDVYLNLPSERLELPLTRSVGFLFDVYDGRLSAVDVKTKIILCDVKFGRKDPLYPVLVIPPHSKIASILLTVVKPEHLASSASMELMMRIIETWIMHDEDAMDKALEDSSTGEEADAE